MALVLVIDDEPNIALVLKIALSDEGHEVITVPNGPAGLERLQRKPLPEIVLVDLLMPGMTGRTVIETMYANPELRDIPVLIITGSLPGSHNLPPRNYYRDLICKPFDLKKVIDTVEVLTRGGKNFKGMPAPVS
ncbi:MAG: response regulator [Firmicutes bacterium]|nr:response regulator [Bacillota bacterium]